MSRCRNNKQAGGRNRSPSTGEILIRKQASSVNFIDTIIRRGKIRQDMMSALPHVPGVEGAGIVEALAEGVDDVQFGDRAAWMGPTGAGGYGSRSVIAEPCVRPIAEAVDSAAAAALAAN